MIRFTDILRPVDIVLQMHAKKAATVIDEVAALLERDERVLDWQALRTALHAAAPCLADPHADFAVLLPHARTDAVTAMVMSVGRAPDGLLLPACAQPVRYVFCIGVPLAMAADYLRLVGLLARLLRDRAVESRLRASATAEDFLAVLSGLEAKL